MKSKILRLDFEDFLKGLLVAILTSIFAVIGESLNNGYFSFEWPIILNAGIVGGLAYLSKNLLSNNSGQFLTRNKK